MSKTYFSLFRVDQKVLLGAPSYILPRKTITSYNQSTDKKLEESYKLLNIPIHSKQTVARQAFLDLAKKYHPDSGSPDACIEKFVAIEEAFRVLTKHNTGHTNNDEIESIVYDIKHTAPQHRQYLSYEGIGHGTPFQRQKQWAQNRAQKAANNVLEHRMAKAVASEKTLMKKGQYKYGNHDIKTKYGFDRLVEDLIQESMSKGEFENLSGKGKPLKDQNTNPYVDFTTHKLNEVLINNGFTPEWITMNKDIDNEIELLKEEVRKDRMYLGPYPLTDDDKKKWSRACESNRELASSINKKINTYNLIVPLINRQKLHIEFEKICDDILKNGLHSVEKEAIEMKPKSQKADQNEDVISFLIRAFGDMLTFGKPKKKNVDN